MKTIILILSLMYNAFCFGQMPDSSSIWYSTKNLKKDTIPSYESYMEALDMVSRTAMQFDSVTIYGNEEPVYHRKRDTVLVNCLVSKEEKDQHCGTVYAVQLYSVRELHNVNDDRKDGGWCINCPNYWEHVYFLELSKEPISENIIVWQSKEIQ